MNQRGVFSVVKDLAPLQAVQSRISGVTGPGRRSPLRWLLSPGPQMERVVRQIRQVANSPLTILVEGETGTGKELVARALHQLSDRCKKPFIAVDCGAIPDTLIEAELFGYERGAFTGAHQRKAGQFQRAEGGSLFLNEIVNLPVPTQMKLLRVLQERQVQPLGGTQPVPVDVRIVAASSVPLAREMRAGRFRQDLYYRLNEFLITLPLLRERETSPPDGPSLREIAEAAAAGAERQAICRPLEVIRGNKSEAARHRRRQASQDRSMSREIG